MSAYIHRRFIKAMRGANLNVIVECGSRDCLDAVTMIKHFRPSVIYSFECNPESIPVCRENIKDIPKIRLIEKAVWDENKIIDFYATDMERSIDKNIGASSALRHRDNEREFFQKKISVEAIRLDSFIVENKIGIIDLLCMDLQGAELRALKGLGDKIFSVRFIILEMSFESYYHGEYLFADIDRFLIQKGFMFLASDGRVKDREKGFVNCMYKNKRL
jgi:FkbM family methyltransferase